MLVFIERYGVQIEIKLGCNKVGVIDCKSVKQFFHSAAVKAEYLRGANAVTVDFMVKQPGKGKLIVAIAGFRKFVKGIENNQGVRGGQF